MGYTDKDSFSDRHHTLKEKMDDLEDHPNMLEREEE